MVLPLGKACLPVVLHCHSASGQAVWAPGGGGWEFGSHIPQKLAILGSEVALVCQRLRCGAASVTEGWVVVGLFDITTLSAYVETLIGSSGNARWSCCSASGSGMSL